MDILKQYRLLKNMVLVLIGVGIGAFIHNYVPQEAIQSIIGKAEYSSAISCNSRSAYVW